MSKFKGLPLPVGLKRMNLGPLHVRDDEEPEVRWISPEYYFAGVVCSFCGHEGHKSSECRVKIY